MKSEYTEEKLIQQLSKAPLYKDELIEFWNNMSSKEKQEHLFGIYVFLDSHRGVVQSHVLSPLNAVVEEFCYHKNRELLYHPELWKENIQLEEFSKCNWSNQ